MEVMPDHIHMLLEAIRSKQLFTESLQQEEYRGLLEMCFEIKIQIHKEADLYNPLDPEGSELSDEVISYMVRKYQEKGRKEKHIIHIISDEPVDEEKVRNSFLDYSTKEEMIFGNVRNRITLKQLTLFVIGILFISLWLFAASRTENLLVEILSIIGSFALWEAADIWIVEKPVMRIEEKRLKKKLQAEVEFTVTGD